MPNHSAITHPWFTESRSSRANAKRDWYIWRDPGPDGGPPNNWLSNFGGPAWTLDPATGQYYYHAFLQAQPDLNWRNPDVRAAMHDALRFWLDRGVDGFRVDVIWHLMKDAGFRDNPANPDYFSGQPEINRFAQVYSADRPEVLDVIAGMRDVLRPYGERVLIGEIYLPMERLMAYYGPDLSGADMPFNFQLIQTPWTAQAVSELVENYEAALPVGGWPNWVLGNHDQPRIAARVGPEQARIAAMLLLTLRGTPTLYYGDEIGLAHVAIPPDRVRDPWEHNEPGHGRDPERTPMQWDGNAHSGFSTVEPWLPLSADAAVRNVDALRDDPTSILTLHRRLLALRRENDALSIGDYRGVEAEAAEVFAYERRFDGEVFRIILNFGKGSHALTLPAGAPWTVLLSTHGHRGGDRLAGVVALGADEGLILRQQ